VYGFRFPVRRNARVSVGLSERKLRFKKGRTLGRHNLYSTQYAHNLSELGITVLLRFSCPISDGGGEREERISMRSMFVRQTIAGVYPARHGSCSLFGSFDVYFIFEGAFHSCYREFTFIPCNVGLGLVEFVFDPPLCRVQLRILLRRI